MLADHGNATKSIITYVHRNKSRHPPCGSPCILSSKGMMTAPPLMVFTDLDGTLIDHHTYDWTPAAPAIAALKAAGAGIVLASSKTAVEIDVLRAEMGLQAWPAIVENGAGLLAAHASPGADTTQYAALRAALADVPNAVRRHFVGFGDMTVDTVVAVTGLTQVGAALAKQRAYSEPGLWQGDAQDRDAFLAHLAAQNISAQQGGRFLTLSFGATKADQMRALCKEYRPRVTIALGDAPNDIKMLQASDYGVVIANPDRPQLPVLDGEAEGRILRTTDAGPVGWNGAMMDMIARLNLT
jgi:mannosyl-3-phosphoglycerate phosphatase